MAAGQFQDAAIAAANKYGVPQNMFLWQIGAESGWDPNARNPTPGSTATGIAQFIEPTAKAFGINPLDPYASLDAAAKYDAMLYKQTGSWQAALTKYGTLADASSDKIAGFKNALSYDADNGAPVSGDLQDFGAGPLSTNSLTEGLMKYVTTGTFIVLGVVIIALAVLSNKPVRDVAVKAVTKGAK